MDVECGAVAGAGSALPRRSCGNGNGNGNMMLVEIYVIPCCRVESYDDISNII